MAERLVFKKTASPTPAAEYIVRTLAERLARRENVLWLVAGGSAMDVAVEAANNLRGAPGIGRLGITLTDERYGQPGHADSNWHQLTAMGFDLPGASLRPVLEGKDLSETAKDYADFLREHLKSSYSLALAGMGPDGHIFGILPGSPAANSREDVAAYAWSDYVRLTPTLRLLKKLNEIVVYAMGEPKWPQIAKLKEDVSPDDQPAQILKILPRVIFFNDYEGEQV